MEILDKIDWISWYTCKRLHLQWGKNTPTKNSSEWKHWNEFLRCVSKKITIKRKIFHTHIPTYVKQLIVFFFCRLNVIFFPSVLAHSSSFSFSYSDLVTKASILHGILCSHFFYSVCRQHIWMCYPHANHKPMWMCYISQAHFIRRLKSSVWTANWVRWWWLAVFFRESL